MNESAFFLLFILALAWWALSYDVKVPDESSATVSGGRVTFDPNFLGEP